MTPKALYGKCNTDKSSSIELTEILKLVQTIKADIQIKQIKAIITFLDINEDGKVTESEFVKRCNDAGSVKTETVPRTMNEFFEEEIGAGDQSIAPKLAAKA